MFFFSRREQLAILLCLGVLTACGGLWFWSNVFPSKTRVEPFFTESHALPSDREESIMVHVCGKVKQPGVYSLKLSSRIQQALNAAGGATAEADTDALNLAAFVKDGERIYVPSKSESTPPPVPSSKGSSPEASPRARTSAHVTPVKKPPDFLRRHPVHLNTANTSELQALPGVGPSTAERIISYRKQNGQFSSLEDLMKVPGIGPKKFGKMREMLRL